MKVFTIVSSYFVSIKPLAKFASKNQKFGSCLGLDSWLQGSVCIGSLMVWVVGEPLDCCFCSVWGIIGCICFK